MFKDFIDWLYCIVMNCLVCFELVQSWTMMLIMLA